MQRIADFVLEQDECLEQDFALRGGDDFEDAREELVAILQQADLTGHACTGVRRGPTRLLSASDRNDVGGVGSWHAGQCPRTFIPARAWRVAQVSAAGHRPAVGRPRHIGWEPADRRFGAALT